MFVVYSTFNRSLGLPTLLGSLAYPNIKSFDSLCTSMVLLWGKTRKDYMKRTKVTPTYQYTNPHPNNLKGLGDCVFRAISIATDKTWLEVYDELCVLGRELIAPPNDGETYKAYLDKIADKVEVMVNRKRLTGKDLAKRKDGKVYIIRTAGHLACIKDGKVRDTWDSGNKSGYLIWEIR